MKRWLFCRVDERDGIEGERGDLARQSTGMEMCNGYYRRGYTAMRGTLASRSLCATKAKRTKGKRKKEREGIYVEATASKPREVDEEEEAVRA